MFGRITFGAYLLVALASVCSACSHDAPAAAPATAGAAAAPAPAVGHEERDGDGDEDDDETSVARADLPAAVEATVAAQSQGATIRGISRSKEDGRVEYELELVMADGHHKDMDISPEGKVLEVEEEVALDHVPDAARGGIQAGAGSRAIRRIEAVSRGDGTLRGYEVVVDDAGHHRELFFGPDGHARADDDED